MQAQAAGGVIPRRIPGLPAVTVQSEIGGPENLGSEMGLQTPAEFAHFSKEQASVCDSGKRVDERPNKSSEASVNSAPTGSCLTGLL